MSFKLIHLHLLTYPTPSPAQVVDYTCALAKLYEARLTVSIVQPSIRPPSHWLAAPMVASAAYNLEAKAKEFAGALEKQIGQRAQEFGIAAKINKVTAEFPAVDTEDYWLGRTCDLGVFALSHDDVNERLGVETWLFQTGHPLLLYPEAAPATPSFKTIMVSWDFSRASSRALTDALPFLKRAEKIKIVTVVGEKDIPVADTKSPILDYLSAHGITAEFEQISLAHHSVGETMLKRASEIGANMLVMGAFGHPRMQEFILGGATKSVLAKSTIPILMSH